MSEVRDTRLRKAGVFFMYILSKNLSNTWDGPFVTLLAFAIGVAINVPLGYLLSTQVFQNFWLQL